MNQMITICRNCGVAFAGNYCNNCGEKKFSDKDRSVWNLMKEGLHFLTHLEGTFFTTLKNILFKPGQFALDYCNGKRKPYFKPLALFLLLVVFYLMFPMFSGLNMDLKYHMGHHLYGEYAAREVAKASTSYPSLEVFSEQFHHKSEKTSKFLLFILIPFMALFSKLLLIGKKRLYYEHFLFSTEELVVFLLWGFFILPLLTFPLTLILPASFFRGEMLVGCLMGLGFLLHVSLASRRFFNLPRWQAAIFAAAYTFITFWFVMNIYKLILFFITIRLMHH